MYTYVFIYMYTRVCVRLALQARPSPLPPLSRSLLSPMTGILDSLSSPALEALPLAAFSKNVLLAEDHGPEQAFTGS